MEVEGEGEGTRISVIEDSKSKKRERTRKSERASVYMCVSSHISLYYSVFSLSKLIHICTHIIYTQTHTHLIPVTLFINTLNISNI